MAEWTVGQIILNEYLIEKELGRGGMGKVWLVKSNSTGRSFAVKQTLLKDEKSRKAFLAELQTWIDLPEHPNIVPCRFFRTVGDEIVIFADYVEGGSLKDWIDQHKLTSLEQILDVAIQFAWGLHAIHERGLIHQDVKPGNVLMTTDGVPMVADFGLARARMQAADGGFVSPAFPLAQGQQSILVSFGGMTPAYASPEQIDRKPLSRKTDIWSWGVSVLDMFMGGVSCQHGGHIAADVLESFIENGQQEDGLPGMPKEVSAILRRCFVRDASDRVANLVCATGVLISILQDITGQEYKLSKADHPTPPVHPIQHRLIYEGVQLHDAREILRAAYRAIGDDPDKADNFQQKNFYSRKGAGVAELGIYEEAERLLMQENQKRNVDAVLTLAQLYTEKALLLRSLDDSNGALGVCDQCIELLQGLVDLDGHSALRSHLALAIMNKANAFLAMGELSQAVTHYDGCINIWRRLVLQEGQVGLSHELAQAFMNKASVLYQMGHLNESVILYGESIAIYRNLMQQEGQEHLAHVMAKSLMNKAAALFRLGNQPDALALYSESISTYKRLIQKEGHLELNVDLAMALRNEANIYFVSNDLPKALKLYDESIAIYKYLVEQEGRSELTYDLASTLLNKANTLADMHDFPGALILHREGVVIYRRLVEEEGKRELANELAGAIMNEGMTFGDCGRLTDAVASFDECITIARNVVVKEGRKEFLGELAWYELMRAKYILAQKRMTDDEIMRTRMAYASLLKELQRTGRADLTNVVQWANRVLQGVL